jgi:hypothetical protein
MVHDYEFMFNMLNEELAPFGSKPLVCVHHTE